METGEHFSLVLTNVYPAESVRWPCLRGWPGFACSLPLSFLLCAEWRKLKVNAFMEKVPLEQMHTVLVNLHLTRLQWNECTSYSLNTWKLRLRTHPPWFLILAAGMMSQIIFLIRSTSAIIRLSHCKPFLSSQTRTIHEKICAIKTVN